MSTYKISHSPQIRQINSWWKSFTSIPIQTEFDFQLIMVSTLIHRSISVIIMQTYKKAKRADPQWMWKWHSLQHNFIHSQLYLNWFIYNLTPKLKYVCGLLLRIYLNNLKLKKWLTWRHYFPLYSSQKISIHVILCR